MTLPVPGQLDRVGERRAAHLASEGLPLAVVASAHIEQVFRHYKQSILCANISVMYFGEVKSVCYYVFLVHL